MAGPCDDRWTPMPTRFRRVAALRDRRRGAVPRLSLQGGGGRL